MNDSEIIAKIKSLSLSFLPEVIAFRRHLHEWPETSFKEYRTADFIAARLEEFRIPFQTGIAKTGIVAIIHSGKGTGKTIALRADMDALPITEANDVAFKSKNEGIMHACGHDVHMASLLGAAKILNELKDEWEGTIKLFFQPSEEVIPGGALAMIEEGVLENPTVENVFGQHVFPQLEAGKIGVKAGKYMASTDEIYITVKGKGGHAATPELYVNPIMIASAILMELNEKFNQQKPADSPSLLAFGRITGEGRTNIIPDEVRLDGTLRAFDESWRARAKEIINEIATTVSHKMQGNCEVRIAHGYPFLINDEILAENVKNRAIDFLGKENVVDLPLRMTAEDFAYFSQKLPSCFYRLGIRNEAKGIISNLHTSTFDVDESSLLTGMGFMAWIAIKQLQDVSDF